MCRLFGSVARRTLTMRQHMGAAYAPLLELSKDHGDGWGVAWSEEGRLKVHREIGPAFESEKFPALLSRARTAAMILHLRRASPGLATDIRNTHPFRTTSIAFAHNGYAGPPEAIEGLLSPGFLSRVEGGTDSERLFLLLMASWGSMDPVDAVRNWRDRIEGCCQYSSLNSMLLTPAALYVVCEYAADAPALRTDPRYYELGLRRSKTSIAVASSGWKWDASWRPLANGTVTRVELTSLEVTSWPLREEVAGTSLDVSGLA